MLSRNQRRVGCLATATWFYFGLNPFRFLPSWQNGFAMMMPPLAGRHHRVSEVEVDDGG
jgi:hypothetical protein